MNTFAIAGILTGISAFAFGYFVYTKNPGRNLNRIFFVLTLSISAWGLGVFFIATAGDPTRALKLWRLTYSLGVIWIPILFHHFVHVFLQDTAQKIQSKTALFASYVTGIVFFVLVQTSSFFPEARLSFSSFYYPIYTTPLYPLFFLWWASLVIYSHFELTKALRRSSPAKKNQIKYFFLATAIGFTGGAMAFLPPFGVALYPYGTFAIPLFPVIMTYAIIKHRLMDIRVVITRALLYSVIITVISWGVILVSTANALLQKHFPVLPPWLIPFLASSLAFGIGYLFWQESKKSDKLKQEFITVVAHKFRTPLTEIRWLLDGLKETELKPEGKNFVTELEIVNNRFVELVNLLIKVAEEEERGISFSRLMPLRLEEVIKKVLKDNQTRIEKKHLNVSLRMEEGLPEINADYEQMRLVIQVLIDNAILYTPNEGAIKISLEKTNAAYLRFSVTDSGIGISPEDLPFIFSKFFRSKQAMLIETEGAGLGLFLAETFVERYHGKISARSEGEGKGSAFVVELPVPGNRPKSEF